MHSRRQFREALQGVCDSLTSNSCRQRKLVKRNGRHRCVSQLLGHLTVDASEIYSKRLPILMMCTTNSGIRPRAKTSPTWKHTCIEARSSNKRRKCSFVMHLLDLFEKIDDIGSPDGKAQEARAPKPPWAVAHGVPLATTHFGHDPLWPRPTLATTHFGHDPLWPRPTLTTTYFGQPDFGQG